MAGDPLYSIVVPTRERADVLARSLSTALAQTVQNFEVVVMDNCGSPETANIVDRLPRERLRYARSPVPLSMADNWERALDHVEGDYVFYLGDDDGILPDAVEIATNLHSRYPTQIIAWRPAGWHWPDHFIEPFRNVLHMHLSSRCELRTSRTQLCKFYRFETDLYEQPSVYNAFVPRHHIEGVRRRFGRYFLLPIPDLFSGIVNLWDSETHLHSYRPLSVWGFSRYSLGSSHAFRHEATAGANCEELVLSGVATQAPDPLFDGVYTTEAWIADVMLKAKRLLIPADAAIALDPLGLIRYLCDGMWRFSESDAHQLAARDVRRIAERLGVDPERYSIPPPGPGARKLVNNYRLLPDRDLVTFEFYTDPDLYRTVDAIVKLVARMSISLETLRVSDARDTSSPRWRFLRRLAQDRLRLLPMAAWCSR